MPAVTTLVLPGLSSSGPEHWQTLWERADPRCIRVEQTEWATPRCADWIATLSRTLSELEDDVVFVAHSSACAMVAHWAATAPLELVVRVRGALLVAPSDPEGRNYPPGPVGFAPMPLSPLPFASTVVASRNDDYVTLEQAHAYARAWGSSFVDIGEAGHINSMSGLGSWPVGYSLLNKLRNRTRAGVDPWF
jgi:predicted alpha/beta hydrolase family esterase